MIKPDFFVYWNVKVINNCENWTLKHSFSSNKFRQLETSAQESGPTDKQRSSFDQIMWFNVVAK